MIKRVFFSLSVFFFLSLSFAGNDYQITTGETFTVRVSNPKQIFIRKPGIIDIVKIYPDRVRFLGKKEGFTQVEIRNGAGQKNIFEVTVLTEDLDVLSGKLRTLIYKRLGIEGVKITKDILNSKVILGGEISKDDLDQVNKAVQSYSSSIENFLRVKPERDLVEVDVEVMELTKSFADALGFGWPGTAGTSSTALTDLTTPAATGTFSNLFRIVDWTRNSLDLKIYASKNQGKGKILARPKLLCLSGEEANFLVGGEVPVVTVTSSTTGATVAENVEYKEYGIKLDIKPIIEKDDGIRLFMTTEVKELSTEGQYVRSDGTTIKAFTTRNASTVLRLKQGQGVIISGLLKDKVTKDDLREVPGLSSVPILGALFRSKDYQNDQTELVISLVPKIIKHSPEKAELKQIASTYKPLVKKEEGVPLPLTDYIKRVQLKIDGALRYPSAAKIAGWQGKLKLSLHIASDGRLLTVRVAESSGYNIFDNAAITIAKDISPYPPFSSSIDEKEIWIDIPIVYKLN